LNNRVDRDGFIFGHEIRSSLPMISTLMMTDENKINHQNQTKSQLLLAPTTVV